MFLFITGILFSLWLFFSSGIKQQPAALKTARLSFAPFFILLLLIPYSFFYTQINGLQPLGCLIIISAGAIIFNIILKKNTDKPALPSRLTVFILLIAYTIFFGAISVLRHLNYQNASSFDVALYSQIQWNNIHGHFFQSSISGSNFVTHNSPFLILLSPFYAIYPHPEALLILKTLFLSLSAIPFYLILKHYLHEKALFPLVLGYLFFPFIVGQNFNAPHETCFLPPLLLFSFYFFLKNRFKSFLFFLLLSLSITEHMALIAITYGLYALYLKKEKRWVITPILLGIVWGIFSIWIIYYFQKIYHTDPYPAWLIDNIKRRFLRAHSAVWSNLLWGIKTSNFGHWGNFCTIYPLLSPVMILLPFFSLIALLGMPELLINLLASLPLTYPTWHYTIVAACFLLIACADSIKKISCSAFSLKLQLPPYKIQELLSWLLCVCILSHFFLWWDYTTIKKDPRYVKTMNAAIELVPKEASVSLTKHLVAYVSNRKDYFLCEEARKGEYIVLDKNETMNDCFKDISQAGRYIQISSQDGIKVYKSLSSAP